MGDATAKAEQLAETLALVIKSEIAPLRERVTGAVALIAKLDADLAAHRDLVAQLRERLAVAEARPPVPGPPGAPGADGFTCDELRAVQDPDDERIIRLGYVRGDVVKEIGRVELRTPRYCGVYDKQRAYLPGDQVTHSGALWHCHAPTRATPGNGGDGWQLQVKRGG
jgi:hypothetical protein